VASEDDAAPWQPSTDAQALANIRSLVRTYIRGDISHGQFVLQFALQCLTHDVATPRPPSAFLDTADHAAGWFDASQHVAYIAKAARIASDLPVVDLEDSCMAPATHDGTGDCGCPAVGED